LAPGFSGFFISALYWWLFGSYFFHSIRYKAIDEPDDSPLLRA